MMSLRLIRRRIGLRRRRGLRGCSDTPPTQAALIWLGRLYFDQKDYVKAIDIYQAALKLKPGNQDSEYFLRVIQAPVFLRLA
ncbi:MAG: tetratricopeptide repeat protein [Deinococcales bacterium]